LIGNLIYDIFSSYNIGEEFVCSITGSLLELTITDGVHNIYTLKKLMKWFDEGCTLFFDKIDFSKCHCRRLPTQDNLKEYLDDM
jgi:hypothetical protein